MTATDHEHKTNSTDVSTPEDLTIPGSKIPHQNEKSCTFLNTPKKGQIAPSSKIEGTVWLRYVPRERKKDVSDTT